MGRILNKVLLSLRTGSLDTIVENYLNGGLSYWARALGTNFSRIALKYLRRDIGSPVESSFWVLMVLFWAALRSFLWASFCADGITRLWDRCTPELESDSAPAVTCFQSSIFHPPWPLNGQCTEAMPEVQCNKPCFKQ